MVKQPTHNRSSKSSILFQSTMPLWTNLVKSLLSKGRVLSVRIWARVPVIVRWPSGQRQLIANQYNREFESHSHFQSLLYFCNSMKKRCWQNLQFCYTTCIGWEIDKFFKNLHCLCSVRLSVRSLAFQAGKTGSIPVPSTICFVDVSPEACTSLM